MAAVAIAAPTDCSVVSLGVSAEGGVLCAEESDAPFSNGIEEGLKDNIQSHDCMQLKYSWLTTILTSIDCFEERTSVDSLSNFQGLSQSMHGGS